METRQPAQVFAPGEYIRDELDERSWTQADLAEILARPVAAVNEIVAGKRRITPDTAKGLAAALGTSPEFWLNLEAAYRLTRTRQVDTDAVERRALLYAKAPVREMLRRGWVEPSDSADILERRVLDFLEIERIDDEPVVFQHAARKSATYTVCTSAQLAWLLRARQLARTIQAAQYSPTRLDACLDALRALAVAPQEARRASRVLAGAGIRLVIVEHLSTTKIDGATFWIDKSSPVIALSLRFDRVDSFWFTLFHEIHHVYQRLESLDVDILDSNDDAARPSQEEQANRFAGNQLIPEDELDDFIARVGPVYSTKRIEAFAHRLQVHPGIVVGALQYRREIAYSRLRKLLVPIRDCVTSSTLTDGWGLVLPTDLTTLEGGSS